MENAFWDGMLESMKQDDPDYDRIVQLVRELRDEICEMAPQNWKQEIIDAIDIDIFSQVVSLLPSFVAAPVITHKIIIYRY